MPKVNSLLLALWSIFSAPVGSQVQTQPQTMLSDAIQTAKTRKAADIQLSLSAYNPKPAAPPAQTSQRKQPPVLPKLWSIRGVGNALHAEVIYQGRIHDVSFSQADSLRVGRWLLVGLTPQEAMFTAIADNPHTQLNAPVTLRLNLASAPNHIQSLSPTFANESPPSASVPIAVASPGAAARPPVPFELLKP